MDGGPVCLVMLPDRTSDRNETETPRVDHSPFPVCVLSSALHLDL